MELLVIFTLLALAVLALGVVSVTITKQLNGPAPMTSSVVTNTNDAIVSNPNVIAAQPGQLTTRTNTTSGTVTMTNSSHGITTGQRVDIYWTGGQIYGATVGTVNNTAVPISSTSSGTNPANANLPAVNTNVTLGICTSAPFNMIGNNMQALFLNTPQNGYFVFSNTNTDLYAAYVTANTIVDWENAAGGTNPLAGSTATQVYMSHSYTSAAVSGMQAVGQTN